MIETETKKRTGTSCWYESSATKDLYFNRKSAIDKQTVYLVTHGTPSRVIAQDTDKHVFGRLAEKWKDETQGVSSITAKSVHPAYQAIIAMGPIVIPYIFEELERKTDHWFWALKYLCKANPVRPEDAGNVPRMREAWLNWGIENGYL